MIRWIVVIMLLVTIAAGVAHWNSGRQETADHKGQLLKLEDVLYILERQQESLRLLPRTTASRLHEVYARLLRDVESIAVRYQVGVHWSDTHLAVGLAEGQLPGVKLTAVPGENLAEMRLTLRFSGLPDRYRAGSMLSVWTEMAREYPLSLEFCRLHRDVIEIGILLKGEK